MHVPESLESPHKGQSGVRRLINAFFYSLSGLTLAFRHESAFRQEIALAVVLIPVACVLPVGAVERVLLIASVLLVLIVDLVMIFPPVLGLPANPQEVASDVSPPWYFSAPYMWISLLPGPVALWSLMGGAGLFVVYPFIDRVLAERGWPMAYVNGVVAAAAVAAMAILMYRDTQM